MRFQIAILGALSIAFVQWITGDGSKRSRALAWLALSVGLVTTAVYAAYRLGGHIT
jgi:hypothetical protein